MQGGQLFPIDRATIGLMPRKATGSDSVALIPPEEQDPVGLDRTGDDIDDLGDLGFGFAACFENFRDAIGGPELVQVGNRFIDKPSLEFVCTSATRLRPVGRLSPR